MLEAFPDGKAFFVYRREERMASEEVLKRLQVQIDGLSQRMRYDANDLDYETHLQRKRELQRILDTLKRKGKQEGFS